MILALLLLTPPAAPSASEPVAVVRPLLLNATVGAAQAYRAKVRTGPLIDEMVAVVKGRKVRFRPNAEFDHVSVVAVGRDGTVALNRRYYGNYETFRETIWCDGDETPVVAFGHAVRVSEYRDARNLAGWFYEDESQNSSNMMPPSDESFACVVEGGRPRIVGRGRVVAWNHGGAVATTLKVDERGRPVGYEVWSEPHVRVLDRGQTYDLGRVRCLGRRKDGAFVLVDEEPPSTTPTVPGPLGLYVWRDGRLSPWVRLPKRWEPLMLEPSGSLLAHREGTAGVLRGRTLTPVRVADRRVPAALAGTTDAEWLRSDGEFAFSTSGIGSSGHDERTVYTLTPP